MKRILKSDSFFLIRGWMVTELGLVGDELLIYAIIYSLSKKGEKWCIITKKTLKLIAEWTRHTIPYIVKIITNMIKERLFLVDATFRGNSLVYFKFRHNPDILRV